MIRTLVGGRRWAAVLLIFLAAAGAAAAFLPRFEVEAGTHVLLNEDDEDLAYYNVTRPEWGYDDYAIVCARRADWFTPESITALKELTAEISRAPYVKSITSILTVPLFRNRPAMGIPIPILLSDPKADVAKARQELLQHTQALGNLVSKDARDISLLVYLDVPEAILRLEPQWSVAQGRRDRATLKALEKDYRAALAELKDRRFAMVAALRAIAAAWGPPRTDEPIRLSGIPIINVNLVEHVQADLRIFGIVSLALFTLAFLIVYRRARWTALPILSCLLPVILIVGSMAATGKPVTVITSNLPVLLFVLMLPYTVYFVERYRERRAVFAGASNLDTSSGAASDIWVPCLYSCTTTMAGFASLATSGISPVRSFGIMMTIGMGVGLACTFLFLPAATAPLRPLENPAAAAAREPKGPVRLLARLVLAAPGAVVVASLALLGVALWGTTKISVETKFIDYFWPSSEVYKGLEAIDTRMGGTTPLEVMLTSREPGYFRTPEGLEAVEAAQCYFDPEKMPVGNVRSLKTLLDEARKTLPRLTVEQLSKIKAAEGQVREFANPEFTVTRVLVRFRETDPKLHRKNILDALQAHLAAEPKLNDLAPRPTGVFLLYSNMLQTLLKSQKDTFAMVLTAIWVMLVVLFIEIPGLSKPASTALSTACFVLAAGGLAVRQGLRHGAHTLIALTETDSVLLCLAISLALLLAVSIPILLARRPRPCAGGWLIQTFGLPTTVLLPQVLPVLVCMGTMGLTGIPLDLVTVMIASIAMGVGIDAAIQYSVRYRIELEAAGGDRREALLRSHATIGRAIWIATSIVVAGFVLLSLSRFVPTVYFGMFTALAMVMGQFAALTLLPSLFTLFRLPRVTK